MIKKIALALIIILTATGSKAQYSAYNEFWLEAGAQHKVEDFTFSLAEGLRTHEGSMSQMYTDLGAQYKLNKFLRFGVGYRYIQKPSLFSIFEYDHRFSVDLSVGYKIGDVSFAFRPRYQQRVKGISGDDGSRSKTYNRNKFGVEYNLNKDFSLELNYEFFYRLNASGSFIDQNRYSFQATYDIAKNNRVTAFYMLQQEIQVNLPALTHVMGLEYSYRF